MSALHIIKYFVHCHKEVRQGREPSQGGSNAQNRVENLPRLPLALFPELLDFAFDQVALQHAEVLQE